MAVFTKLTDGAWGVYCSKKYDGDVKAGQTVEVRKASGERVDTTLASKVADRDDGGSVWRIIAKERKASTTRKSNGYTPATRNSRGYVDQRGHYEGYCGYPCPVTGLKCCPKNGPCHDCQ